ncbi:hypothetical protein D3C72_2247370 [compost metagenome]
MCFHIGGQQLDGGAQAGHGGHQRTLHLAAQFGGVPQGPVGGHVQVHVHKLALARTAGGDMVKPHGTGRLR